MTAWTITWNDLKITVKDRMFVAWLLLFPLFFTFIFGIAFPEASFKERPVRLTVLDNDKSFLSKALIGELSSNRYQVSLLEKLEDESSSALIIPERFAEDISAGKQVELVLKQEQGQNPEAGQSEYSHILKVIVKIIAKIVMSAPEKTGEFQLHFEQLELEQKITLRSELGGKIQKIPAGFNRSVPAMVVMFLLFTILMYGGINLLEERRLGNLERIYLTPATFHSMIVGKWISRVIIGMFQVLVLFLAGRFLFSVYLGRHFPLVLLLSLFFCGTIAALSIMLGSLIRKQELLIVLNILTANVMAALGGCWWPIELVPSGLRAAGYFFPTGWIMDAYSKLIFFGEGFSAVWINLLALSAFMLLFLFLAVKFFKIRK